MSLLSNPIFRLESHARAPQNLRDLRGIVLGRGALMIAWRLVPIVAVAGSIAVSAASLPNAFTQAAVEFALWAGAMVLTALVVLIGSATATGRDWKNGRMEEWIAMPIERSTLIAGKVWGWTLPFALAITVGSMVGSLAWWLCHRLGIGIPLFAPLEGVLMLIDAWAVLFLCACTGVWAGNMARRPWMALVVAIVVGGIFLAAIVGVLVVTIDRALLGGHVLIIGGAWLVGNALHGWSERLVRTGQ